MRYSKKVYTGDLKAGTYAMITDIDKLRSSGIRALVNKPLERREWATTVRRVLDESAQNPSKSSATALEVVRIFQR